MTAMDRPSGPPARETLRPVPPIPAQRPIAQGTPAPPGLRDAGRYLGRRAGIVSRLLANVVDFVIVVVAVGGGYLVGSTVMFLWSPAHFTFPDPPRALLMAVGAALLLGYLTACWHTTGRTYGDLLLGLRVVNHRGERLRLAGAAARAAVCLVFPIGLFYVVISSANRSVADVLLRTSVVYDWRRAEVS